MSGRRLSMRDVPYDAGAELLTELWRLMDGFGADVGLRPGTRCPSCGWPMQFIERTGRPPVVATLCRCAGERR